MLEFAARIGIGLLKSQERLPDFFRRPGFRLFRLGCFDDCSFLGGTVALAPALRGNFAGRTFAFFGAEIVFLTMSRYSEPR